jgi:hypothetical protein
MNTHTLSVLENNHPAAAPAGVTTLLRLCW